MILNITHQTVHNPELVHLFSQFFRAAEQRNQQFKQLLGRLQQETPIATSHLMPALYPLPQEGEPDAEILKKLLS